jgi:diguanylate cyclase (GGDEF)-like protein
MLDAARPDLALVAADLEGAGGLLERLEERGVRAIVIAAQDSRAAWLSAGAAEVAGVEVEPEVLRARIETQLELTRLADNLEKESAARALMENRLRFVARHDPLTLCLNRSAFVTQLRALTSNPAHRNAAWLIYLDLDRLRVINDAADPDAGDRLIRDAAALIKRSAADTDIVGRVGDNAFAAICYRGDQPTIEALAEKLAEGVRKLRVEWEGKRYKTTASIAVLHLGSEFTSASQVLNVADSTCLAAKNAGRSKIRVHRGVVGETVRILRAEMSWAARLRDSIDHGRFKLMRQEILPLRGEPTGERFEVLIRMLGEDNELIGAGSFLPAAERYDVIREIDRWVIDRVFSWLPGRDGIELCSINISGQSVNDAGFADFVEEALSRTGVSPSVVCFELTETAAVSNLEQVAALMTRLRAHGLRFALDDFGSGFSSYAYLKSLPVDHVKIDGMFVKDILSDSVDEAMVASANQLAHLTGKATIAEFVESTEIAAKLAELGVDYGQGFGLARPVPLE